MQTVIVLCGDSDRGERLATALEAAFSVDLATPEPLLVANALVDHDVALLNSDWIERARLWLGLARMRCVIAVAPSSDIDLQISALDAGAADCIRPGISGRELIARVQGLLKRRAGLAPGRSQWVDGEVWTWDSRELRLREPSGNDVDLADHERRLLTVLVERADRTLNRAFLVELLRRGERAISPRAVDVVVSRLRQKLARHDPRARHAIATTRDEGYTMNVSTFELTTGVIGFRLR